MHRHAYTREMIHDEFASSRQGLIARSRVFIPPHLSIRWTRVNSWFCQRSLAIYRRNVSLDLSYISHRWHYGKKPLNKKEMCNKRIDKFVRSAYSICRSVGGAVALQIEWIFLRVCFNNYKIDYMYISFLYCHVNTCYHTLGNNYICKEL